MTSENQNPYMPPVAKFRAGPEPHGSAVKAVAIGLLVDIGATFVCSMTVGILYGISLARSGANAEQIAASAKEFQNNAGIAIAAYFLGACGAIIGGYVCARIAKHAEYKLGGILAALSMLIGILISANTYSFAMDIVNAFVTLAAILFGVWVGARKNARWRIKV